MRRLLIAVVAVGVVIGTGLSFAEEDKNHMAEKVRKFLDNLVGTYRWHVDGNYKGTHTNEWDAGNACLIVTGQDIFEDKLISCTELIRWDGISEDGFLLSTILSGSEGIGCGHAHGKVLSPTLMIGKSTFAVGEKEGNSDFQIKINGKDQFVSKFTNQVWDGKQIPDETAIFSRVKPATREDFEKFCRLAEGRWASELTLRTDWPGMGKKGETITGYMQHTRSENGTALTGNINVGKGWWTEQKIYDPASRQIKTTQALSDGTIAYGIGCKVPGGWSESFYDIKPDGMKGDTYIVMTKFGDKGKTWTVRVTTPGDEENVIATHVWRRLSK